MKSKDFKKWLEQNKLTEMHVALNVGCSLRTVSRFLDGNPVNGTTLRSFERYMRDVEASKVQSADLKIS